MDNSKFVVIDSNAIIHRAFHAYPPTLETSDGIQVNAVYGFATMLLKVMEDFDPRYLICAMDTAKPTFRHVQFTDYKAQRKPTDQSLLDQFPLVEDVINAFNIPLLKREGFEADDIIGTLATWCESGKWASTPMDMVIVSGDRDLLQLVSPRVKVALPSSKTFSSLRGYHREDVIERYGYSPEQVTDYKAMVGDPSDNIPGVKGIGEKTALGLLDKYGTLEEIYKHLNDVEPRWRKLLGEGVEQAYMSKDLATIKCDIDLSVELESCLMRDFDRAKVVELFTKMSFRTLVAKIPKSSNEAVYGKATENGQFDLFGAGTGSKADGALGDNSSVTSASDFWSDMDGTVDVKDIRENSGLERVGFDSVKQRISELDKAYIMYIEPAESANGDEQLVGLFVDKSGKEFVFELEIGEVGSTGALDCETYFYGYEQYVSRVGEVEVSSIKAESADEVSETNIIDMQLLAHLLSSGRSKSNFSVLTFEFLSEIVPEKLYRSDLQKYLKLIVRLAENLTQKSKSLILGDYSKSIIEMAMSKIVGDGYKADSNGLLMDCAKYIESPIAEILSQMENRGVLLDVSGLKVLRTELSAKIESVEKEIFKEVGHEFNVASPAQVGAVIFDELKLGGNMRSRSTREDVLMKLNGLHPVVPLVLKFRELSKIVSTYIEPFIVLGDHAGENGKLEAEKYVVVKTDYKQLGASSGRFSSINPNMQNLPARGELAEKVRELFVAREGFSFVALDYSQVENRIMADISGDRVLIEDFLQDKDIHRATAARVFDKPDFSITSAERTVGKTINFGILYGQTKYGLSGMLRITKEQAEEMINNYFNTYKGVAEYVKKSQVEAKERGYVESMLGRRRYVPGLRSRNLRLYEAAMREAINMPIQGGDADIMKLAMIMVNRLIENKYKTLAYPVLQIHDEMIYEVKDASAQAFALEAEAEMENVLKLKVPLKVNFVMGKNLAELKG